MDRVAAENALARHLGNPFLLLELPVDATREAFERQGAKLLGMLAAGLPGADHYATPLGPRPRSAEAVREALSQLRDPDRRLRHEWWARGLRDEP